MGKANITTGKCWGAVTMMASTIACSDLFSFFLTSFSDLFAAFQKTVLADVWHWKFLEIIGYWVYTTPNPNAVNNITLWRYETDVGPTPFAVDFNTFVGYDANTPAGRTFLQQFQVPAVCQGDVPRCDDARKAGLLKTAWKEPAVYQIMRAFQHPQVLNKAKLINQRALYARRHH